MLSPKGGPKRAGQVPPPLVVVEEAEPPLPELASPNPEGNAAEQMAAVRVYDTTFTPREMSCVIKKICTSQAAALIAEEEEGASAASDRPSTPRSGGSATTR